MKQSLQLLLIATSFMWFIESNSVQAQQDSLKQIQDGLFDSRLTNLLKLGQTDLEKMPFLGLEDFYLLGAGGYANGKENYYSLGFRQHGKSFFLDGMELDQAEKFPMLLVSGMTIFSHQRALKHGFAGPSIITMESREATDKPLFLLEMRSDRAQQLNGYDAEMLLNLPLGKIRATNSKEISLLVAGRFLATNNTDPKWKESYRVKESTMQEIWQQLFREIPYGNYHSTAFVDAGDIEELNPPYDQKMRGMYPYIKLEIPFTDMAKLSLSSFLAKDQQYLNVFENSMFNAELNPLQEQTNLNNYLSWEHSIKLGRSNVDYTVYAQYNTSKKHIENAQHGKNFFNYGYVGSFTENYEPVFEPDNYYFNGTYYNNVMVHLGSHANGVDYVPGGANPGLAAYTNEVFSSYPPEQLRHFYDIQSKGGLINGSNNLKVYELFNGPGRTWNSYEEQNQSKFRTGFNTIMNLGRHRIEIGFETNHLSSSHYAINPEGLWNLMRSSTNFHLQELDKDNPIFISNGGSLDTVMFKPKYYERTQRNFDKNLRQALGLPLDGLDRIQIDSWDPVNQTIAVYDENNRLIVMPISGDLLNLELFSASELLNIGMSYVDYAGYDHTGKRIRNDKGPYSFFEDYSIGAEKISYHTVYASDAFEFKGFKLQLGARLDAYNSRRPVLLDPYLLYPAYTAGELPEFIIPSGIGNNFIVYVDNFYIPNLIKGFRDGDRWFNANGAEISNLMIYELGKDINPYLKDPTAWIGTEGWKPEHSFTTYNTVYNLLPNISLDYNVLNRINFMINYFAYTVNPWSNAFEPNVFLYSENNTINTVRQNSALKPIRNDHFTIGTTFMWGSKLVANAYYVQQSTGNYIIPKVFNGAYPQTYIMYVNDPAKYHTKGVGAALAWYNPSKTGLQSKVEAVKLFPEKNTPNYPEVSDLVVNGHLTYGLSHRPLADYANWINNALSDISAGIYFQYRHGLPYMRQVGIKQIYYMQRPDVKLFNLVVSKEIPLSKTTKLGIRLTIENLLNFKNVLNVYSTTGLADDDGFLDDPEYQRYIYNSINPESFRLLYKLYLNNPENFDSGRIGRLGIRLSF